MSIQDAISITISGLGFGILIAMMLDCIVQMIKCIISFIADSFRKW